jgi:hypothetical protein
MIALRTTNRPDAPTSRRRNAVKFALLYYHNPATDGPSEGEVAEWMDLDARVKDAGVDVYEAGFHPATTAKTVSVRDGRVTTDDGGVASVGDVLAGLYVLDVPDVNAALDWAQRIPTARYGKVEIRPIVEFSS